MRKIFDKPNISTKYLEETMKNIDIINDSSDENEVQAALKRINEISNKNYEINYFFEYWGWISLKDLAKEVIIPEPPKVENIELEEVIEILEIIQNIIKEGPLEEQIYMEYYMKLLSKSLGVTNIHDYIFCPDKIDLVDEELEYAEELGKKIWKDSKENIIYL